MSDKSPKVEDVSSVIVPPKILSDTLGLSERRIRQLAEEGILKKAKRERYSFAESVKSYIIYLKTTSSIEEANSSNLDLDEERAKHERLKIEKTQLQLQVMKGELHYSEDVERVMNDMLSNFKSKILSLPSKTAPKLVGIKDAPEIEEILKDDCYEALKELSEYDPKNFYSDKYIDYEENNEDERETKEGEAGEEKKENTNKDT